MSQGRCRPTDRRQTVAISRLPRAKRADSKALQSLSDTYEAGAAHWAGARDRFVYVYSHDQDNAYRRADRFVMARVPSEKLRERAAYEFFVRTDASGQPVWSADIASRGVDENANIPLRFSVAQHDLHGIRIGQTRLNQHAIRVERFNGRADALPVAAKARLTNQPGRTVGMKKRSVIRKAGMA